MAVLAPGLVAQLQDRSSGFDVHVVDDGRTERLLAAMADARGRIIRIRHPEEPEDPAVNWVGGPSIEGDVIRLVVDLKDHAALVGEVIGAIVDALDEAHLDDAVVGTSPAPTRTPSVARSRTGCPVLDALTRALELLSRGDPHAVQPPEAIVTPDQAASRRRLYTLLDMAIGQWSAADLDAVGLGDLATGLRSLPGLATGDAIAPAVHLAAVGEALVATRRLVSMLPIDTVVHLERHYARCRSFWGPIVRVVGRAHTPTCVQFVGANPGSPAGHLWSWAAANLVAEALDEVSFAVARAGGENTWYERDSDEKWSLSGRVALSVLQGGDPVSAVGEITGLEGDAASAAIAGQDLWGEPVARIALAAMADGGYWIAERTSWAIAHRAASGGADAAENAIRSHLRGHGRQAAEFMLANRDS